ncbi:B- and T-lymphocyte attenuator-like isoform X2 [Heterodontus francisci]|uniref:B- and T-lymphocyte attenuator-like isoform X2 n=1 Tax=Heterodontus francisci TaxID=7792 RepID=UPI00355ACFAC
MTTHWRKMWKIRTCDYFLLAALFYFVVHLEGSDLCSLRVGCPSMMLNYSVGDSLTLNCTVLYCAADRPIVHWCKLHSNSCQPLTEGYKTTLRNSSNATEYEMLLAYTISSLNLTDSGTYRCEATVRDTRGMGNGITVTVFATATTSTMKMSNINTPLWILYSIIVMGIVGTVLFLVLITYFCIRNFNETKEPTANCRRNECLAMSENNGKPTIYENANECCEGTGSATANSLTVNNCNSPGNHRNDAAPHNTIIYASLNTSRLCRKPSITVPNEEDTEYAAINIKN